MPKGQYERRTKAEQLAGRLRELADEIESELTKLDELRGILGHLAGEPSKGGGTRKAKAEFDKIPWGDTDGE